MPLLALPIRKRTPAVGLLAGFAALALSLSCAPVSFASGTGNTEGFAWSESLGFVSFGDPLIPVNFGVTRAETGVTGFAYSESAGWLSLDADGAPGATNVGADYGVIALTAGDESAELTGYAWGESFGFVRFDADGIPGATNVGADYGVTVDAAGVWHGYAWSEAAGYINVDGLVTVNMAPRNLQLLVDTALITVNPPVKNIGLIQNDVAVPSAAVHQFISAHGDGDGEDDLKFAYLYINSTSPAAADEPQGYALAAYDFEQDLFYLADLACVQAASPFCWNVVPSAASFRLPSPQHSVELWGVSYNGDAGAQTPAAAPSYMPASMTPSMLSEITWYASVSSWNEMTDASLAIVDHQNVQQL